MNIRALFIATIGTVIILLMSLSSGPSAVTAQTSCPPANCTYGRDVSRDYFVQVVQRLKDVPMSDFAVDALVTWEPWEDTSACWNPLATTWRMQGSCNFNSAGVQHYLDQNMGVQATAKTLNQSRYDAIRKMLRLEAFDREALRAALDTWGTCSGTGCDPLLKGWQDLWDRYKTLPSELPSPQTFARPCVGEYYSSYDENGPSGSLLLTTEHDSINFQWPSGTRRFAARYTGTIHINIPFFYWFYTETDDGVRLWVDNQLIIDEWHPQSRTVHRGPKGLPKWLWRGDHSIKMEYFQEGGDAMARFGWSNWLISPTWADYVAPGPALPPSEPQPPESPSQPPSPPEPQPPPPPAPSSEGIELISVSSHTVQPNDQFTAEITIKVTGGSLREDRGDHLHNIDDKTYGAWPVQPIKGVVNTGQTYTFRFQMTAPEGEGEYQSVWQMRVGGEHIGPRITIQIWAQSTQPPPPPAPAPGDGIELCDGVNYGGPCQVFTEGRYPDLGAYGWADRAESVRFLGSYIGNYHVVLLTERDFGGNPYHADDDVPDLGEAHRNRIRSLDIYRHQPSPTSPPCNPGNEGVILYQDVNYGGSCVTFTSDDSNIGNSHPWFNDQASSLRVVGSYMATLYENAEFNDPCGTYTSDTPDLLGCSDKVSSIRVWQPTVTPEISFKVDRDNITAGECTTLRWDVENVQAVYLDGVGVAGQGTRDVCPSETTTYTLHVVHAGGSEDRHVTVTVTEAPSSPSAPEPEQPSQPVASANLVEVTKVDDCAWNVVIQLAGFEPGSVIIASSQGYRQDCSGGGGPYSWANSAVGQANEKGELTVTFPHKDWGNYTYTFQDNAGRTASVSVSYQPESTSEPPSPTPCEAPPIESLDFNPGSPSTVGTTIKVHAKAVENDCFGTMRLMIDGDVVQQYPNPEWNYTWYTADYSTGSHTVRLEVVAKGAKDWSHPSVREEIYTLEETPPPLSGNIAPGASRSPDDSEASLAFDGNTATAWVRGLGHRFTVTFSWSQSATVNRIIVWDRPQNSPDNNQINQLIVRLSNGVQGRFDMESGGRRCIDVTLTSPQTIQSVTLIADDASGNNGLSEVEIWTGSKTRGPSCSNKKRLP